MPTKTNISDRQVKKPVPASNTLFRTKEEIEKDQKIEESLNKLEQPEEKKVVYKNVRKTFLLDELYVEAMRIYTYNERLGLSEYFKKLLKEDIPEEVFEEAKVNIAKMKLEESSDK